MALFGPKKTKPRKIEPVVTKTGYVKSTRPKRLSAALYGNSPRIREKHQHLNKFHVAMMLGFPPVPTPKEKKQSKAKYGMIDALGNKRIIYGY